MVRKPLTNRKEKLGGESRKKGGLEKKNGCLKLSMRFKCHLLDKKTAIDLAIAE